MRKDKEQQKKSQVKQLEIFSQTSEPIGAAISGTDKTLLSGVELSSRLEKRRALTENILEKIVDYENLKRAYKQLSDNGGSSCGRKYTIYKLLRELGIPVGKSWNVVMYSQGWWHMSKTEAVNQAMSLNWFAQQGLQSLLLRMKV